MSRRRPWQKPKPPKKREQPVMVECLDGKDEVTKVSISNERYEFARDHRGRKTAPVYIDEHVECFMGRPDMYRTVGRE